MAKIRVLLLIPHLGGGGAERVAGQLARHLDPKRFEVHLGLITADGPGSITPPESVQVHRLGVNRIRQAPFGLLRLIWEVRPQIVLSGMEHLNQLILVLKPFLPRDTRILIRQNTTASLAVRSRFARSLYRWLYHKADKIICQSEAMANDLAENFQLPAAKLAVLANPIDIAEIRNRPQPSPLKWPAGPGPNLLAVGRLAPEKGLDLLLHALVLVRHQHPSTQLTILGTGPEEAALKKLTTELDLAHSITFAGHEPNPADYFPGATLFVLASRFEGMPNALLEAAAGGLPLVTTPCCEGVIALLEGQPGVWVARETSAEALTVAILTALTSANDPKNAPIRFDHTFLSPFDAPVAISAYENLLLESASAEKLDSLKGTGFSPYVSPAKSSPALAAERRFSRVSTQISSLSAASLSPRSRPMKRIAMLIPTIDQIGGAERQLLLLAKGLSARGWRVTVIALSGTGGPSATDLALAGVGYLSLGMTKAWIDPRGWLRYLAWFHQNQPEAAHAHLPHATWFARWVRLLAPVPVLVDTLHTSKRGTLGKRIAYSTSSWLTDRVTCVSEAVAKTAIASGFANTHTISTIPNGIEVLPREISPTDRLKYSYPCKSSDFGWIAVGRLAPVKDYPTLLKAFAQIPVHARLTIAGTGPDELALKRLAIDLGIAERVNFAGFQQSIQPLLQNSDAFVLSSLLEGLPMGVLEASAAGLPVVATDGPGTSEAMVPGLTGFLVPTGDANALAAAMMRVMTMSNADRQAMGARGRELIQRRFSLQVVLDQWEALYADLLANRLRPKRWH